LIQAGSLLLATQPGRAGCVGADLGHGVGASVTVGGWRCAGATINVGQPQAAHHPSPGGSGSVMDVEAGGEGWCRLLERRQSAPPFFVYQRAAGRYV